MKQISAAEFLDRALIYHAANKFGAARAAELAAAANISELIDKRYINEFLIDVRSPAEFAQAHLPKALNYFALNDNEHHEVGKLYASDQWSAKALGASLICKNASKHIRHIIKHSTPYASRVLITCARGGQRSGSLGHILSEIGFSVLRAEGGMKALRAEVMRRLENFSDSRIVSLAGLTASGKTRLLKLLDHSLDLEGLANHLGSTFGSRARKQPSQQAFDYALLAGLFELSDAPRIFLEAESKNIGRITLSNAFYEAMNSGCVINCSASIDVRVANCVADYAGISAEFFYSCLERLRKYLGSALCEQLAAHYERKELEDVARILLVEYYDKVYRRPSRIDYELNCDDLNKAKKELFEYLKLNN